jgi:hypothetical protein
MQAMKKTGRIIIMSKVKEKDRFYSLFYVTHQAFIIAFSPVHSQGVRIFKYWWKVEGGSLKYKKRQGRLLSHAKVNSSI